MALDTMQGPGTRAPEPAPPSRQFSFTGWQVNNPTAPPPGDRLDGEFDRINVSAAQALAWTATILNTDGTLRPGTVGPAQLQPGLFDRIARDIIGECVAPVDQAQNAASSAFVSAAQSAVNMSVAIAQANGASDSAGTANAAALVATQARDEALDFTGTAADAAVQTNNDANDAAKAANTAQDYAVLSEAWAEHMPDTIPPNILAANDITGDHWSARWWANKAAGLVQSVEGNPAYSVKLVTSSWALNGVNTTFPMLDTSGTSILPGAATDLLVSLDGVIQQAGTDYSISASNIVFVVPPPTDATIWAVAGLPLGAHDGNPFADPVISTAGGAVGQFIAAPSGGYCAIVRSDGSSGYLLDAPSAGASFSANRPFSWRMSDGAVFVAQNGSATSVGGPLTVGGTATPVGPLLTISTGLAYRNSNITDAQMMGDLTAVSGISATLDIASGSTLVQAHALNGVVRNRNPSATLGGTVGVCLNAFGTAEVDGAQTWGCAWILQDYPAIGSDTGAGTGRLLQNELDFRVTHAATIVAGLLPTLDATVQPSNADAFVAGSTYNGTSRLGRWVNGFRTYDNECVYAYYVGMSGGTVGTPNLLSQPVVFSGTNGAGAAVFMYMTYNGGTRTLSVQDDVGGNCNMAVNNTMTAGNFVTVAAGGGLTLGTSAAGNGVGSQSISLNTRDAGGTARTVLQTADPSGNLIVSAPGGAFGVNGAAGARALTVSVGSTTMPGSLGVWGHAAPGAKPAAPATLADVIAVLQSYGLCA